MPKLKNPTKKQLQSKLWRLMSEYIRKRDNFVCFTCGKRGNKYNTDAGHFIPQSRNSDTQYDETNVHTQCVRCNKWLGGNMREYTIRMIDKYGREKVDELRRRGHIIKKWKREELEDLIKYYKDKLLEQERWGNILHNKKNN